MKAGVKKEQSRKREGFLTQQEMSAKVGVRQGASACCVCACVYERVCLCVTSGR